MTYTVPEHFPTVGEMVAAVDKTVSGLPDVKLRLAVLLHRHAMSALHERPYTPANCIVLGPTGGGKSFLVRQLCEVIGLPYIEINATSFSEVGYVGRDLASLYLDFCDRYEVRPREMFPLVERWGVVVIDELDKWAMQPNPKERQPGRALQYELLKILEGDVVVSKRRDNDPGIPIHTRGILNIGVGAFAGLDAQIARLRDIHVPNAYMHAEPQDVVTYGFQDELLGRFPSIVPLPPLDPVAMARILTEHVVPRYSQECEDAGLSLIVEDAALMEIAQRAIAKGIGARAFATMFDTLLWRPLATGHPGDAIVIDVRAVFDMQGRVMQKVAA